MFLKKSAFITSGALPQSKVYEVISNTEVRVMPMYGRLSLNLRSGFSGSMVQWFSYKTSN